MPPIGPPLTQEELEQLLGASTVVFGAKRPPNIPKHDVEPVADQLDPDEACYFTDEECEEGGEGFGGGTDLAQERHGRWLASRTPEEMKALAEGLHRLATKKRK